MQVLRRGVYGFSNAQRGAGVSTLVNGFPALVTFNESLVNLHVITTNE